MGWGDHPLAAELRGAGVGARLARGAGASFATHVAGAMVGFLAELALARLMGVEAYGLFALASGWLAILAMGAGLGLDASALKHVAAYEAREEWPLLRGFLRFSLLASLWASAAAALAMTGVVLLADVESPATRAAFLAAAAVLPVRVLQGQLAAILHGFRRVVAPKILHLAVRPATLAALAGLAWLAGHRPVSAALALGLNVAATALAAAACLLALRRAVPRALQEVDPVERRREWLITAMPLLAIAGAQLLLAQADVVMVGHLLGPAEAGVYSAAVRIASIVTFAITAANAFVAPTVAGLHARGRHDDLQRVLTLSARGLLAYSLPAALGVALLGRSLLALFGPEFTRAHPALLVLAGSQLVIALGGAVGTLLVMTGHHRDAAWTSAACAALAVALQAALIPRWGLVGAAIATSIAIAVRTGVMGFLVTRRLGVNPTILPLRLGRR